ncbi:MAG: hypothetical protein WBP26_05320 [Candidatus Saccharimonadales bacterium]
MINFEHDSQMRPSTHNPEMEQQVNQLWNGMITGGQETLSVPLDEEQDEAAIARKALLANIRPVAPSSAHTVAQYEYDLRKSIAADMDFNGIDPASDEAKDWVYEGILATERRHRELRRSDFTGKDAAVLNAALRAHHYFKDGDTPHEIADLSESRTQRRGLSVSDGLTFGYDPNDTVAGLLKNNGQAEPYVSVSPAYRLIRSDHNTMNEQ